MTVKVRLVLFDYDRVVTLLQLRQTSIAVGLLTCVITFQHADMYVIMYE